MEDNLLWHYTNRQHGEDIIKDGIIKVSWIEKKVGLKPAVWFSKQQFWEPTACKIHKGQVGNWIPGKEGMKVQYELAGIFRFGIKPGSYTLISWGKYQYVSKISIQKYWEMERKGINQGGNPKDWFAVFVNIPRSSWIQVESFDGKNWIPVSF